MLSFPSSVAFVQSSLHIRLAFTSYIRLTVHAGALVAAVSRPRKQHRLFSLCGLLLRLLNHGLSSTES